MGREATARAPDVNNIKATTKKAMCIVEHRVKVGYVDTQITIGMRDRGFRVTQL